MIVPPMSKTGLVGIMITAGSAVAWRQAKKMFWITNDIPIAVIRKTSRGALRRRRGR